ncbi:MAG: alpha/beta fold hydrolase [Candidatus Melainabacteria bacterium]|nr:MAG: alpha/beta fold hydrolase [Candidatus Melainabacteria bacterium]
MNSTLIYLKRRLQHILLIALALFMQLLLASTAKAETRCYSSVPTLINKSVTAPKAVAIAIHGFGLHKGSYDAFSQEMIKKNITTYAMDVRGFGDWQRYCPYRALNFRNAINDIDQLVSTIKTTYPGAKIYIIGESMGGAIALAYASKHEGDVDGVIASVPAYARTQGPSANLLVAAKYLFSAGGHIDVDKSVVRRASSNQVLRSTWRNDRYARLQFSISELYRFNHFMKHGIAFARSINSTPVLVLQGKLDKLIKPSGTTKLFDELRTEDKELVMFDQEEHLLLEEKEVSKNVVARIDQWIDQHRSPSLVAALR